MRTCFAKPALLALAVVLYLVAETRAKKSAPAHRRRKST